MQYQSTRDGSHRVGLGAAIAQGLAPGGGLYVPVALPRIDADVLAREPTLATLAASGDRDREIARLEKRVNAVRGELYRNLTPWQRVQVARNAQFPAQRLD